jgi:ActR/RegA family two-component response regulator
MTIEQRAILIIEDDQTYNDAFQAACRLALNEVKDALPVPDVQILQAFTLNEAQQYLDTIPHIDFISVDLALDKGEAGRSDGSALPGADIGGLKALQYIRQRGLRTVTVVITGENNISYATDALQKYEVLHFFSKATFNIQDLMVAVKSALWFMRAWDLIDQFAQKQANLDDLATATHYWELAVAEAGALGITPRRFPSNLELRIAAIRAQFMDQVTDLPIGKLTHHALKQRVLRDQQSVLRVLLVNYAAFQAAYPSQADPLRFFIAEVIRSATAAYPDTFVGILAAGAGDTPVFVVALEAGGAAELDVLQSAIDAQITRRARTFVGGSDRRSRPVIPHVHVQAWFSPEVQFTDLHELLDTIAALEPAE